MLVCLEHLKNMLHKLIIILKISIPNSHCFKGNKVSKTIIIRAVNFWLWVFVIKTAQNCVKILFLNTGSRAEKAQNLP